MSELDLARLNFSQGSLALLNAILGLVMFGVAMDLRLDDFRRAIRSPVPPLIGLAAQFLLLPAATYLLVLAIRPAPSIALGMLLVASCPGGNISNFITHLARGSTALSVTMTALSTGLALVMTPLNFSFWGGLHPEARGILQAVALDPLDMLVTVLLLLGIPMVAGLLVSHRLPGFAARAHRPMRVFSLVAFAGFVLVALAANWSYFLEFVGLVALAVLLHNALALTTGYLAARSFGLPEADRRAVSIEVGIQNSALALVLIFNFFDGLGGMAVTAAWWGIWHIVSGLTVAGLWSRRAPAAAVPADPALR